jgi:hypothetical protein
MPSLEQRLTALEFESPAALKAIILVGVSPGIPVAELERLSDGRGTIWTRQAGESETCFIDRVLAESPAANGVRLLAQA